MATTTAPVKTTFQNLYNSRCKDGNPLYWQPQEITPVPLCLFGDESSPVQDEWNCEMTVQKILALGLVLELPVGQWVKQARRSELPLSPLVMSLLQTNIKDEASHYVGFKLASEAYPISAKIIAEAEQIAKQWLDHPDHPLEKAQAGETGIFLTTLGLLRLIGGTELCTMAARVSEDEFRHVATNRAVLEQCGYNPTRLSNSLGRLVDETLSWLYEDIYLPEEEVGNTVYKDFLLNVSRELVHDGVSRCFDEMVYMADHYLPFEIRNTALYTRATTVPFEDDTD